MLPKVKGLVFPIIYFDTVNKDQESGRDGISTRETCGQDDNSAKGLVNISQITILLMDL